MKDMIITTTPGIEGRGVASYLGIVRSTSVTGFGAFRDFFSGFTDFFGGRSGSYEKELTDAQGLALDELKNKALELAADAIVGVKLDCENISSKGKSFIMVTAIGTAVKLKEEA